MKSFFEFLQTSLDESVAQGPHHLAMFDIDGTTAIPHDVHVHVLDQTNNRVASLSHAEFNQHNLKPGQKYDFSDFRSSEKFAKSKPIMRVIEKIKKLNLKGNRVAFNTARADFDNKDEFLNTFRNKFGLDIDKMHVHRAGNIPGDKSIAEKKADIVRASIQRGNYKHVSLYDDDTKNLDQFLALKKEYPHINFNAHHVDHNGRFKRYTG